jgi:NAD(P)-dependent dehydrogenase (short-subunit alcohol dehydrogenase family)
MTMSSNPSSVPQDLTGQVAIVTGGGRGIGRAIAQALARMRAAVTVTARSREQLTETVALIGAAGGYAIAVPADVTDQDAVERMVAATAQQLGPVDLLVNNAGVPGAIGPLWEVDPEAWWSGMAVHLRGTFLCTRAVLAGMLPRRRGRIINVVGGGVKGPHPYLSSYGCAKTAIVRLTDTLAVETQAYNIAIFALHPGLVRTALTEEGLLSEAGQRWLRPWGAASSSKDGMCPQSAPPSSWCSWLRDAGMGCPGAISMWGTTWRSWHDARRPFSAKISMFCGSARRSSGGNHAALCRCYRLRLWWIDGCGRGSAGGRCEETIMWDSSVGSIVALILRLLAVSLAAAAPPAGKVWRIGVVATFYCEDSDEARAFRNGLHDAGYVEGRDIAIS